MASSNNLLVILTLLFSLFALFTLPTTAAAKLKHPIPPPSSELVGRLCNGDSILNRRFCLKALSNPEAAAAKDAIQLTKVMMKLAAANARSTLNVIKHMIKNPAAAMTANAQSKFNVIDDMVKNPAAVAKALQTCMHVYISSIQSFGMIFDELSEDPQTANYDVSVIGSTAVDCENAMAVAKIHVHRISIGNRFLHYYSNMGSEITSEIAASV